MEAIQTLLNNLQTLLDSPVEGKDKLSFGIFMLVESSIIMFFLGDLFRRTTNKFNRISHPHVVWNNGYVFLFYLVLVILYNVTNMVMGLYSYIISPDPVKMGIIIFRVFERSIMLVSKLCLWYYSIKGGFQIFRVNK